MEPPSASPHRAHVPWQGLLLAASFLTLWSSPTTAQLTVESVPSDTAEGKDVLLLIHNLPDGLTGFRWYKGDRVDSNQQIIVYVRATQTTTPGPAYSQRETIYHNGSLLFQNVTKEDTGLYTLQTVDANLQSMMASVQLRVYPELPKPFITSSSSHPVEGVDSVALTCGPETQNTAYLWWINGQSILDGDRLQLSNSNRTLTVLSVTRRDTGPYECGTQNPVRAYHSDPVSLNVSYGPDVPIIFPSDSHFHPGKNLSLFCFAASNPPAQYSWLINGRPQQATQELFIPNLTAHHSGSYTCRVHSSVTGLSRTAVKNITVSACTEAHTRKATRMADASQPVETGDESPENENTTGLHVGAVAGFITGVLVGVTLVTTLGCVLLRIRTRRAGIQHGLREPQSSPSTPGHGPSGGSTALAPLPGHTTALPIYEELLNPDLNVYCRINPRAEAAA